MESSFTEPAVPKRCESPEFQTTHWSVVLAANRPEAPEFRHAVDSLCANYWYPLYAFVRRQGRGHHEAEDLTQEFFARFLEKSFLAGVSADKGRFRSFLLAAMKHFLANEWNRERTQKRGGGARLLSLEGDDPEVRYRKEPADRVTPEVAYDYRWAMTLLECATGRLRDEYVSTGKSALFEELKEFLTEKKAAPHQEIAARHGIGVSAVGVAIHRLRQRYRELLRDAIAQTVARPEDIDDEIRHLMAVLAT